MKLTEAILPIYPHEADISPQQSPVVSETNQNLMPQKLHASAWAINREIHKFCKDGRRLETCKES
jgi:hypothetical protein